MTMSRFLRFLVTLSVATTFAFARSPAFNQYRFNQNVEKALDSVKRILDTTRNPRLAEHEDHQYSDKYILAEFVTNLAIGSYVVAFENLGLSPQILEELLKWTHEDKRAVTLRFQAEVTNRFLEEKNVKVVTREEETEKKKSGRRKTSEKVKVFGTLKEYHWETKLSYRLFAFGNDPSSGLELLARNSSMVLVTRTPDPPLVEKQVFGPFDTQLTWWLQNIARDSKKCTFSIDRMNEHCKTPRRNKDVEEALEFGARLSKWAESVRTFFSSNVQGNIMDLHEPIESVLKTPHLKDISVKQIFHPILPLMENGTIVIDDVISFLGEQTRTIEEAKATISNEYDSIQDEKIISADEAAIVLLCKHMMELALHYSDAVDYIEHMLEDQLVRAIGKHLTAHDFDEFMSFHNKAIFHQYAPEPFARAIRQADHYPDGLVSIESDDNENINTFVRFIQGNSSLPIRIPINAATSVDITGNRYLHGWMQHRFGLSAPAYQLAARARQFSSFLLVIGTMAGADEFSPKHAIILQNKDEVLVPLLTNVLPSAKEFKDAIASLSPEQQAFAKAFREMQLQSSVFGVCVIQLKPQLEKLLNLPTGALTKEIQLTQDLMSLFVDYQIPSDLLSYDGVEDAIVSEKIVAVKGHTKAVMDVINATKTKQLFEEKRKADMRRAEAKMHRGKVHQISLDEHVGLSSLNSESVGGFQHFSSGPFMDEQLSADSQESSAAHRRASYKLFSETTSKPEDSNVNRKEYYSLEHERSSFQTGLEDFTLIPKLLDAKLEKYDTDGSLRSTIIAVGPSWQIKSQKSLLSPLTTSDLSENEKDAEKKKAVDLLDAISRSGTLPVDSSELHIIIAVSHCFERNIIETIIEDNVNPIEKVEKSLLMLASTIYGVPANELLGDKEALERLAGTFPELLGGSGGAEKTTMVE